MKKLAINHMKCLTDVVSLSRYQGTVLNRMDDSKHTNGRSFFPYGIFARELGKRM